MSTANSKKNVILLVTYCFVWREKGVLLLLLLWARNLCDLRGTERELIDCEVQSERIQANLPVSVFQ